MGIHEAIESASNPAGVMNRVLDEVLVLVPSAGGAAILLRSPLSTVTFAASTGDLDGATGMTTTTSGTLAGIAIDTRLSQRSADARTDGRVDPRLVASSPILSLVCVPLCREDEAYGALMVTSTQPSAFDIHDEESLAGLANFVSTVIGAAMDVADCTTELLDMGNVMAIASIRSDRLGATTAIAHARSTFVANIMRPGSAADAAARDRVEGVLASDGPTILLQPIISLLSGHVVSVEALSRFTSPVQQTPDLWFADAARLGLGLQMELRAIERALALMDGIPFPIRMAVNASPATFCSTELVDLLMANDPKRVIVELTEHVEMADFSALQQACLRFRAIGAEIAVDDTGSGYASLALVLEVAPEIIKLDRELCANIDVDPIRRALARTLVSFGCEIGSTVVAEGIESAAELRVLGDLGVGYGQGFYLARPGSLADLYEFIDQVPGRYSPQLSVI